MLLYYSPNCDFSVGISPQDTFDYDYDSDDDWEEEEAGESLSDSEGEEKEEEEGDQYEVDNDFFVPHAYLSDDEGRSDEEDAADDKLLQVGKNNMLETSL